MSPYAAASSGAQGLPGEMATPGRITPVASRRVPWLSLGLGSVVYICP